MTQKKVIFIVPGFRQKPTNKAYKELTKLLKADGYSPILVSIPWKKSTISENTQYFLKKYKRVQAKNKYILGFSFGAMIAFLASTKVPVSGLILCSLSPYFKEDILAEKDLMMDISKRNYEDLLTLQCGLLAKQIKAKRTILLFGSQESTLLIKRVFDAFHQISSLQKSLISIQNGDHDLGNVKYLHTIHQAARELN